MSAPVAPARAVAFRALERVAEEGAFAAAALDGEIRRARLDPRDAALATEIVYGTLRALPEVDAALAARLRKGVPDGALRAALRASAYQLAHLSRQPAHAVVSDAVGWVRSRRGARLAGVANAVLRRLAEGRTAEPSPPPSQSVPAWLAASLAHAVGPDRAATFLEARRLPPPIGLRVAAGRAVEDVARDLHAARPDAEIARASLAPRGLLVRHAGDPRALPGHAEGWFAIQEEGAQLVALATGAVPGEVVLDACAGRGGKTAALLEALGGEGHVVALDLHEGKLARIAAELARLGLDPSRVETHAVDLTVGAGGLAPGRFDRVLVDAPCTGLGTLHRRPEVLLRVAPDDPARLGEVQRAMLARVAPLVRPGGTLVYAVCSPTREEGAAVAEAFERDCPDFERVVDATAGAPLAPDDDGVLRIGPWTAARDAASGPDAYQLVRWTRRAR